MLTLSQVSNFNWKGNKTDKSILLGFSGSRRLYENGRFVLYQQLLIIEFNLVCAQSRVCVWSSNGLIKGREPHNKVFTGFPHFQVVPASANKTVVVGRVHGEKNY